MRSNQSGVMRIDNTQPEALTEGRLAQMLVRRQMNQAGNILLSALEPLSDDDFYSGGVNGVSAAWTVGHLACVTDLFTSWLDCGDVLLPRWMHDVFNSLEIEKKASTKAEAVDRQKLSKPDILLLFRQAQVRALELLRGFEGDRWQLPTPPHAPDSLPTYGAIWQALGVHTFWHLGELSGCIPMFHGTYTLNTVAHYFYVNPRAAAVHPKASGT